MTIPKKNHTLRGVALVLGAAALWGTTGTAQSLVPARMPSEWVGALRLLVAALFFLPVWAAGLRREARQTSTPSRRFMPWSAVGGAALCMCSYNLSFFAGVRSAGVAAGTAVAIGSGPVWAGLMQAVVAGRAPSLRWWLGAGVAVAGVVVLSLGVAQAGPVSVSGLALCLLAGLSYATYVLLNQRMVARASPEVTTGMVFLMAAGLALPGAAWLAGAPQVQPQSWAVVLWLGVMSTGVAYWLFSHALKYLPASTGVVLSLAEPVVAFGLAVLVVGERPGWVGLLGLAAVLVGLVIVVRGGDGGGRK